MTAAVASSKQRSVSVGQEIGIRKDGVCSELIHKWLTTIILEEESESQNPATMFKMLSRELKSLSQSLTHLEGSTFAVAQVLSWSNTTISGPSCMLGILSYR